MATLIVGATGGVGSGVLAQLLKVSPLPTIHVSTRDPSKHSFPPHVKVIKADLSDPSTYPALFQGVDKAFLYIQGLITNTDTCLNAAKAAGVRHIVFLSSMTVTFPPNPIGTFHSKVEDAIKQSGITYTFLRPGVFNTNTIGMWGQQIKQTGKVSTPYLNAEIATLASEDIATVAVVALTTNKLDNQTPLITGPQSISHRSMLEIIRKLRKEHNKEFDYEEISGEKWKESAMALKTRPENILDYMLQSWKRVDGIPQPVSPVFTELTGQPGMSFEQWVQLHSSEFL